MEPLNHLLAAPSRAAVAAFFDALFAARHSGDPAAGAAAAAAALQLPAPDASALAAAAAALLRRVVYESSDLVNSADAVRALLPGALDARLAALLAQVLSAGLPAWRDAAVEQRVAPPRVEGCAAEPDGGAGDAEPALRLALRVRGAGPAAAREVRLSLDAAALGALLAGMRRVREQLAALA